MKTFVTGMMALFLAAAPGLAQPSGRVEKMGGYQVTIPKAWTTTRKEGTLIAVSPADGKDGQISLIFLKEVPPESDQKIIHRLIWEKFGGQKPDVERASQEEGIKGIVTLGQVKSKAGTAYGMQVSVVTQGRFQVTIALAESEDVMKKNADAIGDVLRAIQFNPPNAANTDPATFPAVPTGSGKYRADLFGEPNDIAGFYFGYRIGLTARGDLGPGGSSIILYKDGTYTHVFPQGGFDAYDLAANKQKYPGVFFRWTQEGDTVILDEGPTKWRYTIDGKSLVGSSSTAGRNYQPIGASTGVKISGVYANQSFQPKDFTDKTVYPNGMWTLTFREDGTFVDNGQVRPLYTAPLNSKPLSDADWKAFTRPGKGGYRVANNTLYLSYTDGRVLRLGFWILPLHADKPRPDLIYINGTALTRRE